MQPHPDNVVGDWDVDDLLFWRALDHHPPLLGILREVLVNGWTLCIPPDTAIPIAGGTNTNRTEPMPTESFARMHILVPENFSYQQQQQQRSQGSPRSSVASSVFSSSTNVTSGGNTNTRQNTNTAATTASSSPLDILKEKAVSFFSSIKNIASPNTSSSSPAPNTSGNNNFPQTASTTTKYFSGGRKDAVVIRKLNTSSGNGENGSNNNENFDDENSVLQQVCKKKTFSDDQYSKTLADSDLGVLVTEGPAWGNVRTCARIVFEQKVSAGNRRTVTFLVLDRALNSGPGAVPAHLRTFGIVGQGISDAIDFLFDADSEFVSDEASLYNKLQLKGSNARVELEEELNEMIEKEENDEEVAKNKEDEKNISTDSENEKEKEKEKEEEEQKGQKSSSNDKQMKYNNSEEGSNNSDDDEDDNSSEDEYINNASIVVSGGETCEFDQTLVHARDFINNLVTTESNEWCVAIVHAAHPLSVRRLERSFQIAIDCFLHSQVYQVVFELFLSRAAQTDMLKWKEVRAKFDSVAGGDDDPVHLGLSPQVWNSVKKYDSQFATAVQRALDSVSASTNPFDKMQKLEQVCFAVAKLPAQQQQQQQSSSQTSSPTTTDQQLVADAVVPLLAYYLLISKRCETLPIHLAYVRFFATDTILGGVSSSSEYALATLEFSLSVALNAFEKSHHNNSSSSSRSSRKHHNKKIEQAASAVSSSTSAPPTPITSTSSVTNTTTPVHHLLQQPVSSSLPRDSSNTSERSFHSSSGIAGKSTTRFEQSVIRSTQTYDN